MSDSDFTMGFKQGQEHGKQIMLEKIEDIRAEIKALDSPFGSFGEWYDAINECLNVIDKHISGKEMSKIDCNKTSCNNCVNHNYCDYENNKHISGKENG